MSIKDFLKEFQYLIDNHISLVAPGTTINDHERRLWILNDELLYNLALSQDVNLDNL